MKKYIKKITEKILNTKMGKEFARSFLDKEDPELSSLRKELEFTRIRLESARSNFDYAKEDEMIEYYTYIILANEVKFGYLTRKYQEVKQAKEYKDYSDDLTLIPEELKERRAL